MIRPTHIHIVVDTREQDALTFAPEHVTVIRHVLPAGDYSLEGMETRVAIERKSLDDLVNTVIHNRERFYREIEKLRAYESACIVVEGGLRDVLQHRYRGAANPHSVFGAVLSIILDSGIPVYFCTDRPTARFFIEEYLRHFQRKRKHQ